MRGSKGKPNKGEQKVSLGKYLSKNLGIGVPVVSSVGLALALLIDLSWPQTLSLFLYFLFFGAAIGALVSLKNYYSLLKPIYEMEKGIILVAQGDLTQEININKKSDLADIGRVFNQMVKNFNIIIHKIGEMANLWVTSSEELSASSQEVTATNSDVASNTSKMAEEVHNQVRTLEQMRTMVTELENASRMIAQRAKSVSKEAVTSERHSEAGLAKLSEIVTTMEETNQSVNNSVRTIEDLADQSNRIGLIAETIAQVANQTNLLALNAAIEAARAGNHGRGFAVVADEIRKLAEDVASSTREVTRITTLIQHRVDYAVKGMMQTDSSVKISVASIQEAQKALEIITHSTKEVSANISDIASSSEQTLESMEEMKKHVNRFVLVSQATEATVEAIEDSTTEVASTMQNVASEAQSLAQNASQIQQELKRFKVLKAIL
ncbi:methyl-accepting chemotaxis protein [Desulfosporosinus sp.]|uniref:methyl-accepting chemotaxis protein n=1 Tax=Desulfosporosinus sp. TaxID=157907 RepID=UPI0025BAA9F5|nr:methyl-accepting chemotaxis protein [Desulfosporosinus sp.]MBC2723772.1 methyl-accepting chemotaxis protein [Desulfosporosinus sp.]MBC2728562.1 methyl-accepting chemotaxis protein [Desulfosporosinus sp.]